MNKTLSKALQETVKEIQGYSQEDLKYKLDKSKESFLAKSVSELREFEEFIDEGKTH